MSGLREAAQQALEALKLSVPTARAGEDEYAEKGWQEHRAAMVALNAALAEPEEPVAWISEVCCVGPEYGKRLYDALPIQSLQSGYYKHTPLYTAPPQRPAESQEPVQEPAQETVMYQWQHNENGRASVVGPFWGPLYLSSPQRPAEPEERNFCPQCGKRTHTHDIHTCTPPQLWEGEK